MRSNESYFYDSAMLGKMEKLKHMSLRPRLNYFVVLEKQQ
jgi:hypothetical protein